MVDESGQISGQNPVDSLPKAERKKTGRPKERVADKVDLALVKRLYTLGFTDELLGFAVGVTERTINNWKDDEDFLAVCKAGKAMADSNVVKTLQRLTKGYNYYEQIAEKRTYRDGSTMLIQRRVKKHVPPNVVAIIFWLKNRLPAQWRDRLEIGGLEKKEPTEMNIKEVTRELAESFARLDIREFDAIRKLIGPGDGTNVEDVSSTNS
jgi:hypothetical protein